MSSDEITIVSVDALSYSGTTWLNLLLGSHERAFTLGPPHSVWAMRNKGFEGANLVHGANDKFWHGFDKAWHRNENFLLALAEYADVSHIIFDNPASEFVSKVMVHPRLRVKRLRYLRDGRALSASYRRRHPETSYLDSILPAGWLYHSFMAVPVGNKGGEQITFRFEVCSDDPLGFLEQAGKIIGLQYSERALRFWEWDHHLTVGNGGTVSLLRLANGYPVEGMDFYKEQFRRLQIDPMRGFESERWRNELSRKELFFFDRFLGEKNAQHGYDRDVFSDEERERFGAELNRSLTGELRRQTTRRRPFEFLSAGWKSFRKSR